MEKEDYLELIEQVKIEMNNSGLSEFADDRNYVVEMIDDEAVLFDPEEHLIALLKNMDSVLKRRSYETYQESILRIQANIEGDAPEGATVELLARDGDLPIQLALSETPDFTEIHEGIFNLLQYLREGSKDDD